MCYNAFVHGEYHQQILALWWETLSRHVWIVQAINTSIEKLFTHVHNFHCKMKLNLHELISHTHMEYICTSSFQFAPFSFVAIIPCPNFKVMHCQWLTESRFLCKQNACYGCPHGHFMVAFSCPTSRWSETNIICCHISRCLSIIWLVPVQAQRVFICVQGWSQGLNWPWN